jgi:hypothetical protein
VNEHPVNEYTVTYAIGTSRHDVQNRQVKVRARNAQSAAMIVDSRLPAKIREFPYGEAKAAVTNVKLNGDLFA